MSEGKGEAGIYQWLIVIGGSLDAVSRREQSLGLFHALGKVLYNKSQLHPVFISACGDLIFHNQESPSPGVVTST